MTIIRVNCQTCGDIELSQDDLTIRICLDKDIYTYYFKCPTCNMITSKTLIRKILDLLISAGVEVEVWRLPNELCEEKSGDPISIKDIDSFCINLNNDDTFKFHIEKIK